MSALSPPAWTARGALASTGSHAEERPADMAAPLSIDRRDSLADTVGRAPERGSSSSGRWSRWQRSLGGGAPHSMPAVATAAHAGAHVSTQARQTVMAPESDTARELAETRELLLRYQDYVEGSVLPEVTALEQQLTEARHRCQRLEAELACRPLRSRSRRGSLAASRSPSSHSSGSRSAGSDWGSGGGARARAQQQGEVLGSAPSPRVTTGNGRGPHHPLGSVVPRSVRVRPAAGSEAAVTASVDPAVCSFLNSLTSDGARFTAALCHLADTVGAGGTSTATLSAGRAFSTMRAGWQQAEEELRAAPLASARAVSAMMATVTHAQSQDHLRLVEVLKLALTDNVAMGRQLRQTREELDELRRTAQLRASEAEEDHAAELEVVRATVAELEARVAGLSAALASHASATTAATVGSGAAGHHPAVAAYVLPVAQPGAVTGAFGGDAHAGGSFAAGAGVGETVDGGSVAGIGGVGGRARPETVERETQTALSLEFITGVYARNHGRGSPGPSSDSAGTSPTIAAPDRGGFGRLARRERDGELIELLVAEVETLRAALAATTAERNVLAEQRDRFLCQVECPQLDYRRRLALAGHLGNLTMSL